MVFSPQYLFDTFNQGYFHSQIISAVIEEMPVNASKKLSLKARSQILVPTKALL